MCVYIGMYKQAQYDYDKNNRELNIKQSTDTTVSVLLLISVYVIIDVYMLVYAYVNGIIKIQ